jgi:spermidine/putrescine transport system ATP-binding protein
MDAPASHELGFGRAPIVRLTNVHKHYDGAVALQDFSLDVQEGEFLTLLGPSGCGKTTTLRMVSGFERPSSGSVTIDGRVVTNVPPFKRDVNTVFQNYALFPHLSVFDNVAYALAIRRLPRSTIKAKVTAMLERVELADKAARMPSALSGGQMQRVALARALINEPKVLLLDEPLAALDAKLRRAMQYELRRMHADLGITFIAVTHDQEEALVMSDRIAVLREGSITQLGTPRDIFERPANRFVADFIGGCNFIPGTVTGAGKGVRLAGGAEWPIAPPLGSHVGGPVTVALRPQKLHLAKNDCGDDLVLDAVLKDVVYVGAAIRLVTILGDGVELVTETFDGAPALRGAGLAVGEPIRLTVAASDVLVFQGSPEAHAI